MRSVDISYIAGFLDGEGCISLSSRNRVNQTKVTIEVSQRKREVLDWIVSTLGYGRVYQKKCKYGYTYVLCIFSNEGRAFLPMILPYLRVKHKQAELIMDYYNTIDNLPYKSINREEIIDSFINRFRLMNKRGNNI